MIKLEFPKWYPHGLAGWLKLIAFPAAILLLVPLRARAQFGLDPCCAIISAGLNTVSGLLKSVVAKPLADIQQIRQQAADFEQQVVYPLAALDRARQSASALEAELGKISDLYRLPVNSATLSGPQRLERSLLSRDPGMIAQIGSSYSAVYGNLMPPADAPQPIRDLVDMSDAEAQAAFKKAIEIDAIADVELETAARISEQLAGAAPGSAAILDADASSWVVRAEAYTQSALAELIRLRSMALAREGAQLKLGSRDLDTLRGQAAQTLGRGAR